MKMKMTQHTVYSRIQVEQVVRCRTRTALPRGVTVSGRRYCARKIVSVKKSIFHGIQTPAWLRSERNRISCRLC